MLTTPEGKSQERGLPPKLDDPKTQRPQNSTTPKLNNPKTQRPQNSTTPKLNDPETQRPQNSMTPKLNYPKTWQTQNSTTPILNPKTQQPQNSTSPKLNVWFFFSWSVWPFNMAPSRVNAFISGGCWNITWGLIHQMIFRSWNRWRRAQIMLKTTQNVVSRLKLGPTWSYWNFFSDMKN